MKKLFKSRIFIFILGVVLSCSITSVLAYTLFANNIGFSPTDTSWNVNNVQDALDNVNYMIKNNQHLKFALFNNTGEAQIEINQDFVNSYNNIKLVNRTIYSGNSCSMSIKYNDGTNAYTMNLNQEYNLKNLYAQNYRKLSITSNGWCWINYELYN